MTDASTTRAPARPRRPLRIPRSMRDPLFVLAVIVFGLVLLMAALANFIAPTNPLDMMNMPLLWPFEDSLSPLGTDQLGRDLFSGIIHGSRATLMVGFASAFFGLLIGTTVGSVAGYFGGWVDIVLMRITEIFQIMPTMLLVIIILAIANPSIPLIAISIGLASWPMIARLARAEFKSLREADFVMASKSMGYPTGRIILREILPNAAPTLIVGASVLVANGILLESAVSFLNLGDPNVVSWGSLIGNGRTQIRTEWYLSALPGLATVLTVLSLNIIGDRLTDILNPRSEVR
ncbi:ABC transporter permease [Ketogulonicigenium vulgare]|uniref:Putative peptide ABC transporter permease protein, oppC-like protein n=1 Tax=Ketogulonicigenium vulgare (strain WSH-001) TaxID=759362 RepID=F9Y7X6_KETVW|nr:ABC transporter permease [Ketogulonicigenium vulgare]ADO42915.1 ABC transporter, permease protein [Ketogulonicigenium vulgare Y25]AEM41102.1 putative peptide ABC transporter permease protein, oppC-like protein [Ketogulonicigenium vulgare WSH-001]ALJ81242.1 ABC transporter permease [Ketogulonicigenium vulgare]ANW33984.1 ABC transporter permease [Ketogulonicigenium vulgare]AOZ54825.1 ABC transporter permease [Ketogulonicigenium vulgare]